MLPNTKIIQVFKKAPKITTNLCCPTGVSSSILMRCITFSTVSDTVPVGGNEQQSDPVSQYISPICFNLKTCPVMVLTFRVILGSLSGGSKNGATWDV